jgi:hypothetical protein
MTDRTGPDRHAAVGIAEPMTLKTRVTSVEPTPAQLGLSDGVAILLGYALFVILPYTR